MPARPGPRPLVVLLHGAGGAGRRVARLLAPAAQATGCLVVAPDSRALTWDAVTGDFGADVAYLSRVLTRVFARCAVDVGAPPHLRLARPRRHHPADRDLPPPPGAGLRRRGYAVRYREFDGSHGFPPEIAGEAMDWLLGRA